MAGHLATVRPDWFRSTKILLAEGVRRVQSRTVRPWEASSGAGSLNKLRDVEWEHATNQGGWSSSLALIVEMFFHLVEPCRHLMETPGHTSGYLRGAFHGQDHL